MKLATYSVELLPPVDATESELDKDYQRYIRADSRLQAEIFKVTIDVLDQYGLSRYDVHISLVDD